MPKLFGLDIAKIVNDSMKAAGGLPDGTLTRTTTGSRTASDLTAGPSTSTTDYAFTGFLENLSTSRRSGTLVRQAGQYVTILGASLPEGIEPTTGDRITIEGQTFEVTEVPTRDPAAATYICRVQG